MGVKKNLAAKRQKMAINRALKRKREAEEAKQRREAASSMHKGLLLAADRGQYATQP